MKPFYLIVIVIVNLAALPVFGQVTGGVSYSFSLPQAEMKENIRPIHGFDIQFLSRLKKMNQLAWGVEMGFGQYASFTRDQNIRFPDGSGITTKVGYSSSTAHVGIVSRLYAFKDKKINPYLGAKLGYASYFSKVVVADPDDEDDCKALDKKTPISDHSFFVGAAAGLQINISSKKKPGNAWIDISVNHLFGSALSYINVKDIKNQVTNDPTLPPDPESAQVKPLSIRFVNVATQMIHEHQLAKVYNSPLRQMEFKVAFLWKLEY